MAVCIHYRVYSVSETSRIQAVELREEKKTVREELRERKNDGQERQQKALSSGGKVITSDLEAAVWNGTVAF